MHTFIITSYFCRQAIIVFADLSKWQTHVGAERAGSRDRRKRSKCL